MKNFIITLLSMLSFCLYSQEIKEIIKINIDNECKSCISKTTFENEIYTKQQLTIIDGMLINAKIGFAYKENFMFDGKGKMIYFHFNKDLFKSYNTKIIYININEIEYQLTELVDFTKNQNINKFNSTMEYTYSLGYVLDSMLENSLKNAQSIKIELINNISHLRKTWDLNQTKVKDLVDEYNCFFKYYSPIDRKLVDERKKAEEEYEKKLKSYETNFRNSKWFDTKEDVKNIESAELTLEQPDALAYKVKLNNDEFLALFYFNKKRFYQGVYLLKEKYVNENNFYNKYNEIKSILIEKYGEPKKITKKRSRNLYNGIDEIGMAIQTGEYTEYTLWETKNSTILLIIEGENFDSKLTIRYNTKDPELSKEIKVLNIEKSTEGF